MSTICLYPQSAFTHNLGTTVRLKVGSAFTIKRVTQTFEDSKPFIMLLPVLSWIKGQNSRPNYVA